MLYTSFRKAGTDVVWGFLLDLQPGGRAVLSAAPRRSPTAAEMGIDL